jgi:hypothetical protein
MICDEYLFIPYTYLIEELENVKKLNVNILFTLKDDVKIHQSNSNFDKSNDLINISIIFKYNNNTQTLHTNIKYNAPKDTQFNCDKIASTLNIIGNLIQCSYSYIDKLSETTNNNTNSISSDDDIKYDIYCKSCNNKLSKYPLTNIKQGPSGAFDMVTIYYK